jgi:hypothetical protein
LVVTNQLANTQGLSKSEALAVVNIGGDGAAPCVTIELLIIPSIVFLEVEVETQLGGNSKITLPLYKGGRYCTL